MADPLGVSTGQGKGFAQQFGDTYNPFFKEQALKNDAKVAKADKTISDSLGTISTKELWNRDIPLLNEKKKEINAYVRENYQSILNGDLTAIQQFQDEVDDISNLVHNSKETKKTFYQAGADMLKNPGDYTDAARDSFAEFSQTPGRTDVENVNLEKKFKDLPFQKKLSGLVQDITRADDGLEFSHIDPTTKKEVFTKTEKTKDELVRELSNQLFSNVPGIDQIYTSAEDVYKQANKYITNKTKNQIKTPNSDDGSGGNQFGFTLTEGVEPFDIQQPFNNKGKNFYTSVKGASTFRSNNLNPAYNTLNPIMNIWDAVENRGAKIVDPSGKTVIINEGEDPTILGDTEEEVNQTIKEIGSKPFKIVELRDVYTLNKEIKIGENTIKKGTVLSMKDMEKGFMTAGEGGVRTKTKFNLEGNVDRGLYALGVIEADLADKDNFQVLIPYDFFKETYGTKTSGKTPKAHAELINQIESNGYQGTGDLGGLEYFNKIKGGKQGNTPQNKPQGNEPPTEINFNKTVVNANSNITTSTDEVITYDNLINELETAGIDLNSQKDINEYLTTAGITVK